MVSECVVSLFAPWTRSDDETQMRTHLTDTPYLVLSQSPVEILDFLGLDPEPHRRGFSTVRSMFEWLTSSPYFDVSLFPLVSPSGKDRRQISRPGYVALVDFLDHREPKRPEPRRTADEVAARFGVTEELRRLRADDARRRSIKAALTSASLHHRLGLPWPNRRTVAERDRLISATQTLRTRLESIDPLPSSAEVDAMADEIVRTL